jgi:hypothetical protein
VFRFERERSKEDEVWIGASARPVETEDQESSADVPFEDPGMQHNPTGKWRFRAVTRPALTSQNLNFCTVDRAALCIHSDSTYTLIP